MNWNNVLVTNHHRNTDPEEFWSYVTHWTPITASTEKLRYQQQRQKNKINNIIRK